MQSISPGVTGREVGSDFEPLAVSPETSMLAVGRRCYAPVSIDRQRRA